jgi:hypothetical protein
MTNCVACEAYPGHTGSHYSLHDLTTLFYNHRRHSSTGTSSMVLPGARTHEGEPIAMCMRAPEHPDARFVDGIWLVEASAPLIEKRYIRHTPLPAEPGPVRAPLSCSLTATVPLGSDAAECRSQWAAPPAGEQPVARRRTCVHVACASNGRSVDIRAALGLAAKHASEHLRVLLHELKSQEGVSLQHSINRKAGEVRVRVSVAPGSEGKLLEASGRIMDSLGQGHAWDEVELVASS